VPPSMHGSATRMMAPPTDTTRIEAGATTAGRTAAPRSSHRVHESSVKPSAGLGSRPSSASRPNSTSTSGRRTPSYGSLTTA
jgi:hypothetical protein